MILAIIAKQEYDNTIKQNPSESDPIYAFDLVTGQLMHTSRSLVVSN